MLQAAVTEKGKKSSDPFAPITMIDETILNIPPDSSRRDLSTECVGFFIGSFQRFLSRDL